MKKYKVEIIEIKVVKAIGDKGNDLLKGDLQNGEIIIFHPIEGDIVLAKVRIDDNGYSFYYNGGFSYIPFTNGGK